jgi:hypothetical protein
VVGKAKMKWRNAEAVGDFVATTYEDGMAEKHRTR